MLQRQIRQTNAMADGQGFTNQETPGAVSEGLVALKLQGPTLSIETLERALSAAIDKRDADVVELAVDFSEIDELVGPWTIHLAILIHLSKRIPVHVCGLHGQPLQAAWLYRGSPEIREMFVHPHTAGRQRAA
jgi:hypothetical protein